MALSKIPIRKNSRLGRNPSRLYPDSTKRGGARSFGVGCIARVGKPTNTWTPGGMFMRTTDARDATAPSARTVASIVGGRTHEDAPGGSFGSVNPARTDETVAEVLLGDAGTFVAASRAAREAQKEWAAV